MSFCLVDFLSCGTIISLPNNKLLLGWGEVQTKTLKEINSDQPAFYVSDFFLQTSQPWVQYTHWSEFSNEEFKKLLEPLSPFSTCDWTIHNPEQFKKAFHELSQDLNAEQLEKAVLYLFANSSSLMTSKRLCNCLTRGLHSLEQKAGYLYGHWNGESGVIGITPELLFSHSRHQSRRVKTMALAGTCHSSHCQETFIKSEKEQHEHQIVIQGICQSLQALGSVKIGTLQLLQLPRLTHLMTPIEIELNHSFCFDTLVHCLHPTPALGAFPIREGKKWLENYQKHTPRQYYGVPIGFKHPQLGLSQCLISIRNVQWDLSGMRIGAGCGVVKQSHFDKEWKEIQFKIRAIRDQLCL